MISVIFSLLALGFLGAKDDIFYTFSKKSRVLRWGNSEFIVEAVMPDLSHVIPVVDNTMFDGIRKLKDSLFGLGFLTHVCFLIVHADHDVVVLGATHNGWER